jgi:hypothetical protein
MLILCSTCITTRKYDVNIFRPDQAISLPKGIALLSESGARTAEKVLSNISDGMEWWRITSDEPDFAPIETSDLFGVEPQWSIIL